MRGDRNGLHTRTRVNLHWRIAFSNCEGFVRKKGLRSETKREVYHESQSGEKRGMEGAVCSDPIAVNVGATRS